MTTTSDFQKQVDHALSLLVEAAPMIAEHVDDPGVTSLASMMALSWCDIRIRLAPHSVRPAITVVPAPAADTHAAKVVSQIGDMMVADFGIARNNAHYDISKAIDQISLLSIGVAILKETGDAERVNDVYDFGSEALKTLSGRITKLMGKHRDNVFKRDLPGVESGSYGEGVVWALALQADGRPERATIIDRRLQAVTAYGAVSSILREPRITAAIDAALPLAPELEKRLEIDAARLRRINGIVTPKIGMSAYQDKSKVVQELTAFDEPLHVWESAFRDPAWAGKEVWHGFTQTLLPPPYVYDSTEMRDSFNSFVTDVLRPIAVDRATGLGLTDTARVAKFLNDLNIPASETTMDARRAYLRGVKSAVIGDRGVKSFREATMVWHRRAKCAAALRHENRTESHGWPAICAPWTSSCGSYRIEAITTAAGLVHEGNVMNHCVGGYYDHCRTGRTHILSMTREGQPAATVEMLASVSGSGFVLSPGQFKTFDDERPNEDQQSIFREFTEDLRSARHRVAKKAVAEYIKEQQGKYDAYDVSAMTMVHARAAWPLYRVMMPRPTPETLDEWIAQTGIDEVFDAYIMSLAGRAAQPLSKAA